MVQQSKVWQLVDVPTIENTQLASIYQYTSPQFTTNDNSGDDDLLLIYFGSQSWIIEMDCELIDNHMIKIPFCNDDISLGHTTSTTIIQQDEGMSIIRCCFKIWLFILNGSITLNFPNLDITIRIPYESIIVSGISESNSIYMNLSSSLEQQQQQPIEISLYPVKNTVDEVDIYPLFKPFQGMSLQQELSTVFERVIDCINLTSNYKDTDDEAEAEGISESNDNDNDMNEIQNDSELKLYDIGQADDELNDDLLMYDEEGNDSVMYVELSIANGIKRSRGGDEQIKKTRKFQ
ncbi:hypothetical protein CANARDRAFT_9732 [[Candida] arabinofermentans NRRL YB-2248]|uniref:Protein LOT5 n=1 Tax=[Candida] arabinofermentans NRRL YB-2248 TaxID=983967 RepID=A0A1E4SUZ1_9ASCO|nr:hypothetical protein CANARDRAFT_9732 [[Candida] arabinofermentans NRRL YB-2248]